MSQVKLLATLLDERTERCAEVVVEMLKHFVDEHDYTPEEQKILTDFAYMVITQFRDMQVTEGETDAEL